MFIYHFVVKIWLRLKNSSPGIPSPPPYGSYVGSGPSGSAGDLPISANFVKKNQRMNAKTIAIIALSAFVLLLVSIGAVFIFVKWRKVGRPSSAVGPAFASSTNKRSGKFVNFYARVLIEDGNIMQCFRLFMASDLSCQQFCASPPLSISHKVLHKGHFRLITSTLEQCLQVWMLTSRLLDIIQFCVYIIIHLH